MKLMLSQERIKRGWTQDYVAQKCGVSYQTVCDWENSRRKPSYEVLVKLLDLFACGDPRVLFGAETPDRTKEPDGNQAK